MSVHMRTWLFSACLIGLLVTLCFVSLQRIRTYALSPIRNLDKDTDDPFRQLSNWEVESDGHSNINTSAAYIYLNAPRNAPKDNIAESQFCDTKPALYDWSFRCYQKCPVSIQIERETNVNVQNLCPDVKTENISVHRNIFTIPYNSSCLRRLVAHYCNSDYRVPNIAHFVWFSKHKMEFIHFVSFISVLKIQKPCLLLVHSDVLPFGQYWEHILRIANNVIHVSVNPPETIYGRKFGFIQHKADVHRLICLRDYGGMYFDSDQILLKSLDPLRNYSFTQSVEMQGVKLGNSLLVSVPQAKFVSIWLEAYRSYNPKEWSGHSTVVPYHLSKKHPDLIRVENGTFIRPNYKERDLIFNSNFNWTMNYAIHIYSRSYKKEHNFYDICTLRNTIGSVSRFILYGSKELCHFS